MFLLDTNVVSEMRRRKPSLDVQTWVNNTRNESQFLSVISLTEIAFGASRHPDPVQRHEIQRWMHADLRLWFQDRVLVLTEDIAETAGFLIGVRQRAGKALSLPDALLAASAMRHKLTLTTRNTKDFMDIPVDVYDPWENKLIFGTEQR